MWCMPDEIAPVVKGVIFFLRQKYHSGYLSLWKHHARGPRFGVNWS